MEFQFNLQDLYKTDQYGITIITKQSILQLKKEQYSNHNNYRSYSSANIFANTSYNKNPKDLGKEQQLQQVINIIGELSRKAQGLGQIVTTYEKMSSSDDILFLKSDQNKVYGMLRIGKKNLFYTDRTGKMNNIQPMCVLDFYVHESCQRTGIGKLLFEVMLEQQQTIPDKLAYDKPSNKLRSFLKKHYGLTNFIPQNNNFVIFNSYFTQQVSTYNKNQDKNDPVTEQQNYTKGNLHPITDHQSLQKKPVLNDNPNLQPQHQKFQKEESIYNFKNQNNQYQQNNNFNNIPPSNNFYPNTTTNANNNYNKNANNFQSQKKNQDNFDDDINQLQKELNNLNCYNQKQNSIYYNQQENNNYPIKSQHYSSQLNQPYNRQHHKINSTYQTTSGSYGNYSKFY